MFRIKFTVIKDLISLSHLSYTFYQEGSFVNIPHERLETEAYLEPDNSKSVFILKTNSFENNIRYEIDFPLNEEGIEKYVDYVIFKVEKKEKTKAFNNLFNILNLVFGGITLQKYLFNYRNCQFERKLTGAFKDATFEDTGITVKLDNYTNENFLQKTRENFLQKDSMKSYVDKKFEEARERMPEYLKKIALKSNCVGNRPAKVIMETNPIVIPRCPGDSGKYGNSIGDVIWDDFIIDTKPLEPKGIQIYCGQRSDGKTATDAIDALNYFLETLNKNKNKKEEKGENKNMRKQRPDSIMIDEEHRIMVAFLNGKRFVAECHDGDKFDFRIGFGTIVSKCNDSNAELQYLRKKMKWNEYYLYCYNKFFYFNEERIKAFENKVLAEKEQFKLRFNEEEVRKYRCKLNGEKYKERKVTHNFIVI